MWPSAGVVDQARTGRVKYRMSDALSSFFAYTESYIPGVSKGCCLEVFKYLRVSKKHSFLTPGYYSLERKPKAPAYSPCWSAHYSLAFQKAPTVTPFSWLVLSWESGNISIFIPSFPTKHKPVSQSRIILLWHLKLHSIS